MKRSIITATVLGLTFVTCAAAESQAPGSGAPGAGVLSTENDKINYSLGFELGKDLRREDLELAPDALLEGVRDAISGAAALVDAPQRKAALVQIKQKRAGENLEMSKAFLAANGEKEGITTLESGLQYREIESGNGKTANASASVVLHYRGTLVDGTQFDSSYDRGKPATFLVRKLIRGLAEAVQLMQEGDKWEIFVPPELGYGRQSPRHKIPPNSALIFEVEVLTVRDKVASPRN